MRIRVEIGGSRRERRSRFSGRESCFSLEPCGTKIDLFDTATKLLCPTNWTYDRG